MAAADLNGNGLPDLVVANGGGDTVSVLLADGAAASRPRPLSPWGRIRPPWRSADLKRDGKLDLVTANSGDAR